jgi:hypothetical protein
MFDVTARELELLQHALGVRLRNGTWSEPYRNNFVASNAGSDFQQWEQLVAKGLACSVPYALNEVDPCTLFRVTDLGLEVVAGLTPWNWHPEHRSLEQRILCFLHSIGETPASVSAIATSVGANSRKVAGRLTSLCRRETVRQAGSDHGYILWGLTPWGRARAVVAMKAPAP